ncbi:hypothetical protein ABT187_49905 [Streptomyces sp. NPDC001817]|uniref:hypothetical protein n=1 Tax=Streptomyces sp. NPDC001817 TaxID=3154398 RepID=UPI0033179CF2
MDGPDLLGQVLVGLLALGAGVAPVSPLVVAGAGHLKESAQPLDLVDLPVVLDELAAVQET